jgi:hypothetical protein
MLRSFDTMEDAMRLYRALTAAALAAALAGCGSQRGGTAATHRDSRQADSAAGKLVVLDVRALEVEAEVVEGGTIEIAVELDARSSSRAAARRWVERNTPAFADSPARLEITTPRRGSVSAVGYIETEGVIRLKVPAECRLEITTGSGDVVLRGSVAMAAPVRVKTGSGDVTVRGGARELVVDTASGDVRVTGETLARLEVDTASGDVTLDAGADRAAVETASGECVLRRLRGGLTVSSKSGDVEARWLRLAAGERVDVETSSGEVALRLPQSVPVRGTVTTSGGSIESELPGEEDRRGRRFTLADPPAGAEAQPGGGAVELSVRTGSGDVRLLSSPREI